MYFTTLGKAALETGENPPIGVAAGVGSLAGRLLTEKVLKFSGSLQQIHPSIHSFIYSFTADFLL